MQNDRKDKTEENPEISTVSKAGLKCWAAKNRVFEEKRQVVLNRSKKDPST